MIEFYENSVENILQVLLNLLVCEAEYAYPQTFNPPLTSSVVLNDLRVEVRIAVDLNGEARRRAVKVDNKPPNALLSTKFISMKVAMAEMLPEGPLSWRNVIAKLLTQPLELLVIENHGMRIGDGPSSVLFRFAITLSNWKEKGAASSADSRNSQHLAPVRPRESALAVDIPVERHVVHDVFP